MTTVRVHNLMNTRISPALFAGLILHCTLCVLQIPLFSQTSSPSAPLPGKSDVLAAIAVIEEKLPDSSASAAVALITRYAANSPDVTLTISPAVTPWMKEDGRLEDTKQIDLARGLLLAAYFAGNVKSQLAQKSKNKDDDMRAGWLTVIRVHERFASQNLGAFPSVERLAQLEKMGWLAEYAGILKQEHATARRTPPSSPVPAKERLTRDYLIPAQALVSNGRYAEARALYETWLAQNPDDAEAHVNYAHIVVVESNAARSSKVAKAAKKAARSSALKAAILGSDNPLLATLLGSTDPNAKRSADKFSDSKKAHKALETAEKAFAQRRYNDAIKAYKDALKYDPQSYMATLYMGDSYYAQGNLPEAIVWFDKAVALNPGRETAHRYMGDALLKSGKPKEALVKHIDALIAEPANRLSRTVMQGVARTINPLYKPSPVNKLPVGTVSFNLEKKEIALGLDPVTQSMYVTGYLLARGAWIGEHAANHFPKGAKPRHCAAEEMAGLRLFSMIVLEQNEKNDADASAWLGAAETIRRLDAAGLLEAFVYIDRMDADIAKDYPAYREKNRSLLVRYIREFWLGEEPAKEK